MRHAVELYLKGAIESTSEIAKAKGIKLSFDLNTSHDIGLIWDYLKNHCLSLDERFEPCISSMDDVIKDIAKIDPTGQTFRYPHDIEIKKHLADTSLINVINLKVAFNALEDNLERLDGFIHQLSVEYGFGTHTKHLSRAQLVEIARQLPPMKEWRETSFADIKRGLKQRYSIGSAELSQAISLIKSHFELVQYIGGIKEFDGLEEADLTMLFDQWIKLHPEKMSDEVEEFSFSQLGNSPPPPIFEEIINYGRVAKECTDYLVGRLSQRAIANIAALFELPKGGMYSELFELDLENETKALNFPEGDGRRELRYRLDHLMRKPNLLINALKSLYFLGHTQTAESLIARYESKFSVRDLEEIRKYRPVHLQGNRDS
jgi:hypothetical protein